MISRRRLFTTAAQATALASLARLGALDASAQGGGAAASPPANQNGMRLVLLGTQGGPNVNTRRAQGSNALVVDGRPYLVDCGYGAVRSLVAAGLGLQQINTGFITHLHDDHMADVAALLSLQWTGTKRQPTDIYGPFGTAAMVEAALAFTRANTEIRMTDEGRTIRPEQLFHGHDVPAQAMPVPVFKDDRLSVTAVESTHYPARATAKMPYRALAFRFDADGRSVVITGDTAYSKNIVGLARGVDLFVCEIIDEPQYEANQAAAARARAAGNEISVAQHVVETHSNNELVGRMASEAGVKTVVLTHLLPGSNRPDAAEYPDSSYIDGVRKFFSGEVIVGRDLMVL